MLGLRTRDIRMISAHGAARIATLMFSLFGFVVLTTTAEAVPSRIKDIADFEGIRQNMLIGYGLVVGLKGTGDKIEDMPFTRESLIGMLERLGINTRGITLKPKNIAAVIVTSNLPPFGRQGSDIDVTVSALGDAQSLLGGTLLVTPLVGADGEVYAVAQGQVQIGGFEAQGDGASISKGVSTSGRIPSGAVIEREIPFSLKEMETVHIALRNPDLTTARRVASAINAHLGRSAAVPKDPGTVQLHVPKGEDTVSLLTDIEQLQVEPDQMARVVIDEQTGIIVIGENVRVSRVAIAQGNLTIKVTETPQVSQPNPFAAVGETAVVPRTQIEVDEGKDNKLGIVDGGVSLQEVVNGLNAMGIGPRDMISILQAIKAAGALQAEIEVM